MALVALYGGWTVGRQALQVLCRGFQVSAENSLKKHVPIRRSKVVPPPPFDGPFPPKRIAM